MADKNTGFWPGLIVVLGLLMFFGGILWLSGRNVLINRDYRLYFEFSDISGLRNQSPVAMRGYQVGRIADVTFGKESIRVAVDIKKKFAIPADSQVEIITLNFIGEKAVSIIPGVSRDNLQPGAALKGKNKDLMIMAANLLAKVKSKIDEANLDAVIGKAKESMDSLLALVRNVNAKVGSLDMDLYNRRVEDIGRVSRELSDFLTSVSGDTKKVGAAAGESLEKFNQTLAQANQALDRLTDLSAEIKGAAQSINRPEIFDGLSQTLRELKDFLADIKKNPKKYVRFSIF